MNWLEYLNLYLRGLSSALTRKSAQKTCVALAFGITCSAAIAQDSDGTMSADAVAGQNMQNRLYPQIQLPLSYNYNQKLGANSATQQAEIGFGPVIPIGINSDVQLILNPFLTYNRNISDQQITNQNQPIQIASFFVPTYAKEWYFGIGPYIQGPASNPNNGSRQTGVGFSAAGFFTPEHWVAGAAIYNSWGLGNNMTGGSANVLNVQPTISYTTDKAWTYSFISEIVYNYDARAATNQLTLSGGKTFTFIGYPMLWQVGPTYMVTTTPTSAKGLGGFLGLTLLLPK